MPGSTFQTNLIGLLKILDECQQGIVQLLDFQRSWVWDEDRNKGLIASISRAFPVGALMSLETGGETNFKPRPVEGGTGDGSDDGPAVAAVRRPAAGHVAVPSHPPRPGGGDGDG